MRSDPIARKAGAFCLAYFLISFMVFAATGKIVHLAMAWNLLLAALPLALALLALRSLARGGKIAAALWAALWLLFFPNAPYLATDFIHMNQMDFYTGHTFSRDLTAWVRLAHISFGVLLGNATGFYSFSLVQGLMERLWGRRRAYFAVGAVSLLSGYAVFMGRFLRLNSWDVLRPVHLISTLLSGMDGFAASYSLLFAAYTLCGHLLFRLFFRRGREFPPGREEGSPNAGAAERNDE